MINVISQSTAERNQETMDNFEKIRPLLDKGYTYSQAVYEAGLCNECSKHTVSNLAWFRELYMYGATQGYPYKDYKYKNVKG